jgi:1-phosphofructokinase
LNRVYPVQVAATEVVTVTLNPAIDQTVTIPNFVAGSVNRVEQARADPGGKGVNVASILADVGHPVAVTGFLGRDNAAPFEELFERKRIVDRFVRIAGQTRVGIKVSDPLLHQTTDINFPGQAPLPTDVEALIHTLDELDAEWFVLSGSIPPGVDVSIYRTLAAALKRRGRRVLLDTSGEGLRLALQVAVDAIKPNVHELEVLVGHALPDAEAIVAAVQPLLEQGIRLIAVSMGSDGACFVDDSVTAVARPPRVEVKSTVGAGDAMVAGIVSAQLRGLTLADCARLATAFSLDAITHLGSGLSSSSAVDALLARVTVDERRREAGGATITPSRGAPSRSTAPGLGQQRDASP